MYLLPYRIDDCNQLHTLTEMADYYRSLPALSRTFLSVLLKNPTVAHGIEHDVTGMFSASFKLRNEVFFRECLVWAVCKWGKDEPDYSEISDTKLRNVALMARHGITLKLAEVQQRILALIGRATMVHDTPYKSGNYLGAIETACCTAYDSKENWIWLPEYIRQLNNTREFEGQTFFQEILQNNLVLHRGRLSSGIRAARYMFLCAEISDEGLPWDPQQTVW